MPGYFLDTSALAKLYHPEAGSPRMESLASRAGAELFISDLAIIEMQSAFATKVRTGFVKHAALDRLLDLFFKDLADLRFQVAALERAHFFSAASLVRLSGVTQALRALDAIQLAVAIELFRGGTISVLVASDRNLCEVAQIEGLPVIDPLHP